MKKLTIVYFAVIICLGISAFGQEQNLNQLYQEGFAAYQQQDFETFRDNMKQAHSLNPNSPNIQYNLACGFALTGQGDSALILLESLAERGIDFGAQDDSDLDSIKENPRFKALITKLENKSAPISNSIKVISLPESDVMIEGITYDKVGKKYYFGSMNRQCIYALNNLGRLERFKKPGEDGLNGVVGTKVDPLRRIIWVCSNRFYYLKDFKENEMPSAELIKFDLEKGLVLGRYSAPKDGQPHSMNDLTVMKSTGDVFITDDISGAIYKVDYGKNKFEIFLPAGSFMSPNGITLSDNEKTLYIADYADGLYEVDLASKVKTRIPDPEGFSLFGIDGLYYYENSLVAVQNGYNPEKVIRYHLNKADDAITESELLEFNSSMIDDPTTGTIVDGSLYYIGISGIANFSQGDYRKLPDSLCVPARILKVGL